MKSEILHIDNALLHKAFSYTRSQGLDLSAILEDFLIQLISHSQSSVEEKIRKVKISNEVKSLAGRLNLEGNAVDWDEAKQAYFREKYGV